MKTPTLARVAAITLLAAAGVTSAMAESASIDPGYATYRRVVLGDSSIAQPQAQVGLTRLVPGPYARHLIYLGQDENVAIRHAREAGEQATLQAVAPSGTRFSGGAQ